MTIAAGQIGVARASYVWSVVITDLLAAVLVRAVAVRVGDRSGCHALGSGGHTQPHPFASGFSIGAYA